jgi:nitrogen fixation protein FixH
MRVRPFIWFILITSCVGVLLLAAMLPTDVPATMQIHLEGHPTARQLTTLTFRLADPEGLPIDQAYVISTAAMTNMNMVAPRSQITAVGRGTYIAQFHLYMAGPWAISVTVQAPGFALLHQTVFVQVV